VGITPGPVIAIDGPSGSGKSSTARGVARALGLRYLDTGATYRALTWWLLSHDVDTSDPAAVAAQVGAPRIEVSTDPDDPWTRVDGKDVSASIRTREVSSAVSAVAAVPEVRARLIALQRAVIAAARTGIVAEGRDIGTVVAPDAALKVFLTAGGLARATRHAGDQGTTVAVTEADQARRDRLDAAQSGKAPDAVEIDSTDLGLDEVIDLITRIAQERAGLSIAAETTR
jgi:CMP/dCMP kinase